MDTLGKAQLTEEIAPQQAVVAYVPREEIITVLRDPEAQPELELQFAGGDEPSRISMEWSRNELEDLLARATGDTVVLTFDRDELASAFADVEAHGLRERALVFAVAATGALGVGAGIANAQLANPDSGGPAVTSVSAGSYTDASSGGGYAAAAATTPAADMISDAASGGYAAAAAAGSAADSMVTDASSGAGYTAAATGSAADSMVTDASSGAGYAVAATGSAADSLRTDASSGAGYAATETGSAADSIRTDASSGAGYTAAATGSAADTMLSDASSGAGYAATAEGSAAESTIPSSIRGHMPPPGASSGATFSVQSPDATDTFIVGGVLLTLAGAAFASRRTRPPVQPA